MTAPSFTMPDALREEVAGMNSSQREDMRTLAKQSNFFLGRGVLGYDQFDPTAHAAYCRFFDTEPKLRRMALAFRGFLKSTIGTITDGIRVVLNDPEDSRILIANEIDTNSQNFLDEIKQHWEKNELLRALFPELVPVKLVGPGSDWRVNRASIRRSSSWKEATWTTIGLNGSAQSQHFTHIKADDLIGLKHKNSPAEMQHAISWANGLRELLANQRTSRIDVIGTRKLIGDVYDHFMRIYAGKIAVFTIEPFGADGESIFPLKFPTEFFMEIMQTTPDVWFHDYMNNPIGEGGTDWGQGLVRYFTEETEGRFSLEDRHTGQVKQWDRDDLDVVITVDPNSGEQLAPDKAAVAVGAMTPDDEILALDMYAGRPSPDGLVDKVFELACKHNPRVIGFEKAGQQNTMYYFERRCQQEGRFWRLVALEHKNKDKAFRIRSAMDTPLKSRRVYLRPTQTSLATQIALHPQLAAHNWDEIDAFSWVPTIVLRGEKQEEVERRREVEHKVLSLRGRTGYGRSYAR